MKFELDVLEAQDAVSFVVDSVSPKSLTGSNSAVKIRVSENKVRFTTYVDDVFASVEVSAKVSSPGGCTVESFPLKRALLGFRPRKKGNAETSHLRLSLTTKGLALMAKTTYPSGTVVPHRRVFPIYEEFIPNIPEINKEKSFFIPTACLVDGIKRVSFSVSSDDSRVIFTGISFVLSDSRLILSSSNAICWSEYIQDVDIQGNISSARCLVPGSFLGKIPKFISKSEGAFVQITDRLFLVQFDNKYMGTALINGEFPNFSSFLKPKSNRVVVSKEILMDNLSSVLYNVSSEENNRVSLKFGESELSIVTESCENSGIPVEKLSGTFQLDFDIKHLEGMIRNLPGDRVMLDFELVTEPVILSPAEDSFQFRSIVAPLK